MYDSTYTWLTTAGSIGVMPTDTIYGLVARASDKQAVERLYRIKHRENKPGTLIAADIDQLVELGIKRRYLQAVADYWPGPLSVVIPTSEPGINYLHQGKMSLAVRLPKGDQLTTLLKKTGPLLTSSANLAGQPQANTIAEAKAYFGDQVDFYIDAGDLSARLPSTVIRVVDDAIEVLRQGAVEIS